MHEQPGSLRRLGERLLFGLLCVLAFLLACRGFIDPDFWWHLKSGEWILQHRQVPDLDPFTYASADRPWIDLHWLFQCLIAEVHAFGGIRGVVVFHALVAAASIGIGVAGRNPGSAGVIVTLCWLPALLVAANRFLIRPELLSLLYLAVFLAVLSRLDDRPRLVWILPFVQLLWVNSHGLFIFGPIVLGLWLAARVAQAGASPQSDPSGTPDRRSWWKSIGLVAVLVGIVCLLNPYGLRGALFPLELYAKVTSGDNPYKQRIWEFQTPAVYFLSEIRERNLTGAQITVYTSFWFRFLLVLLPVGIVVPAAARASQSRSVSNLSQSSQTGPVPQSVWLVVLGLGGFLAACGAALNYGSACPGWLESLGHSIPAGFAIAVVLGGAALAMRRDPATGLVLAGGVAIACWTEWLNLYFAGTTLQGLPPLGPVGWLGVAAGTYTGVRFVRGGGDLFSLLLALVFGYLALNAINSLGRFGLVSGFVLGRTFAPWATTAFTETLGQRRWFLSPIPLGLAMTGWLVAAIAGVTSVPGAMSKEAFGESPLASAHDAARFAGQAEMPERALVFDLPTANVYVYHNAPEHRPFMDARLEVPSLETFQTYVAVEKRFLAGHEQAAADAAATGAQVVVLTHDKYHPGEAVLLAHPDWRLVHYDAMAAVYLRRGEQSLEHRFPTLDLGARHFQSPLAASVPDAPGADRKETFALVNIGTALARFPELTWQLRIPILLSSFDRADQAMQQESNPAGVWTILGNAYWALSPNLRTAPPIPASEWNLRGSIRWAQQSYCLRQAQSLNPTDVRVLTELRRSLGARQMIDAMRTVGEELLATGNLNSELSDEILEINKRVGPPMDLPMLSPDQARVVVGRLLQAGRVEDATRLAEIVGAGGLTTTWDAQLIDQIAGAYLQMGDPIRAREMWDKATASHKEADRLVRLAATYWAERDLKRAVILGQQAREKDPQSAEAHWLLAWLYAEQGDAEWALRVIDDAQSMPEVREEFDLLKTMLLRYRSRTESR